MRAPRSLVTTLAVLAGSILLTACFTGKRGHLEAAAADAGAVSDPAIQAVIAKLETANTGQYTAVYQVITKFGNLTVTATVAQNSPVDRSITIGNVRFLDQQAGAQTCDLTTGTCDSGLQDQRISDTQLTHDFFSASPALRLRHDQDTMVSAAVGSTKEVAGQNATCVQTFFAAGSKTYCALDDGLLAQQDTPDLRIDLTSLTTGADAGLFSTVNSPAG
jgi:hypothetical protein